MAIRTIVDVWNLKKQRPTTTSDDNEDKKSLVIGEDPEDSGAVTAAVTASERVEKI
jgi:hypothetical protein